MRKIIFLSSVFILFSVVGFSQCKYKSSIPLYTKYVTSESEPKVEVATPVWFLFSEGMTKYAGAYSFIKSKNELYLYLHFSGFNGQRFEILETNPVILTLSNDSILTLFPNGNYSGRKPGPLNHLIPVFYKITIEELKQLANYSIVNLKLNHVAEMKYEGCMANNDGTFYWDIPVKQGKKPEKFKTMANCMLNHK